MRQIDKKKKKTHRHENVSHYRDNQGNYGSSGNQQNVIKGQEMENRSRKYNIAVKHKVTKNNKKQMSKSDSTKTGNMDQVHR